MAFLLLTYREGPASAAVPLHRALHAIVLFLIWILFCVAIAISYQF